MIDEITMEIELPENFEVTYVAECGEEVVMFNCLFPSVTLMCEDCGVKHLFIAEHIQHKAWHWDAFERGIGDEFFSED